MKKTLRIFSLMLILAVALSLLASCNLGGEVTVTWKYGQKVLHTETVSRGSTVSDWKPVYGDRQFNGWYADAGLVEIFDFTAPITADTEIYASFGSGSFEGGSSGPVIVHLIPDADWSSDGSAYGVWCWGNPELDDAFILASDIDGDGTYEVEIPAGYTNMLFVDVVPDVTDFSGTWNWDNKRAQTGDLVVPTDDKVYFFVEVGSWSTSATDIPEPPSYENSDIRFVGTFNDWDTMSYGENDYKLTLGEDGKTWTGTFVVTADMYRDYNTEEIGYACATIKLYDASSGTWINALNVEFKDGNAAVTEGTWHFEYVSGASGFTYWADGEEKPETPDVSETPDLPTESSVIYLVPSESWKADGARFVLYVWNDAGDAWIDMTDADADGAYEVTIPAGYVNLIFCRMNPDEADNLWDNMWNQTNDLLLPSDGTNCFTVAETAEAKYDGTWSAK